MKLTCDCKKMFRLGGSIICILPQPPHRPDTEIAANWRVFRVNW